MTTMKVKGPDEDQCPHLDVKDHYCKQCSSQVPTFYCTFDKSGGQAQPFIKIVYENGFLDAFKSEYIKVNDAFPSLLEEGDTKNKHQKVLDTIYTAY